MYQRLSNVLAVDLTCPSDVEVGDRVKISDEKTVAKLAEIGSPYEIGTVARHKKDATVANIETPFRERRDDRVSGAAVPVGPIVFGIDNAVYPFTPGAVASITGAETETFAVVLDTSDELYVRVGNGVVQSFVISAGATLTAAAIVAEINATAVGFRAEETATGAIKLVALEIGKSLEIVNPTVSILGTQTETFAIVADTSDAFQVKVGTGPSQVFTLTDGGTQGAADVVADINKTAFGFHAEVDTGAVKLVSDVPGAALEIEAVSNDAYTVLGFTAAAVAPATAYTVLGFSAGRVDGTYPSHDPAGIRGVAITPAAAAGETIETLEF